MGEQGRHEVSNAAEMTSHKVVGSVERIFETMPKPLEWRSFYSNDLNLLVGTCLEAQDAAIQHNLNKSQTRALAKDAVYPRPFPAKPGPMFANVPLGYGPSGERGICFSIPIELSVLTNPPALI